MGNYSKVLFLDSAQATVKDLSRGYSKFILAEPFGSIPDAKVACSSFSFTNFFINISAALGNNTINYSDDLANPLKYTITIPNGSYSVTDLNKYVENYLKANHAGVALWSFVPNYSTNKIAVQWGNVATWYITFGATSPFTLLGFNALQRVPAAGFNAAYEIEYGPNDAAFNNITNVKLTTNLTSDSISNTNQSNVLLTVAPIVEPGSTQFSQVYTLLWLESTCLRDKITCIELQVLDQLDRPLLLSEDFSCTLLVQN